ncbi:two-component response regulator ORR3-like isoform X2 [Aristolochia californica]|uniref:two-component response regulator ORR3-like isoform X2 n=1 Tax=Aristolochia californica TaxID=171875 RepID=UPI0035D77E47
MGEGPRIHVLVVDDCVLDRKIVEKLLLKIGVFKVTTADSGEKALEVLGLNEDEQKIEFPSVDDSIINIILTDYCMPGMNGYDLLRAVKEHKILQSIPVVLMSSENDPLKISRCRDIGAEDFILKPLLLEDIQKLRDYVGSTATPTSKIGSKRKMTLEIMTESNESERRPHMAGLAVA